MYYYFVFNISIDWFVCSFFITLTSRPLFLCVFFCVDHCHERFVSNGLRQFEVGRSVRWWWWWWSWFEGFYCRRWWRVLNWIKLNECIFRFEKHPVQYHTHIATTTKIYLSHDIIYILYYFGSRKIFFSEWNNPLVNKDHISTYKRVYTTNDVMLLPPYEIHIL